MASCYASKIAKKLGNIGLLRLLLLKTPLPGEDLCPEPRILSGPATASPATRHPAHFKMSKCDPLRICDSLNGLYTLVKIGFVTLSHFENHLRLGES